jgi:hypothetical protein
MDPDMVFVMPIALMFIMCSTGVAVYAIKSIFGNRGTVKQDALLDEIRSLREEVLALRRQNNDVVLALDTSLQRIDQRLTHAETRGSLGAGLRGEIEAASRAETAQRR